MRATGPAVLSVTPATTPTLLGLGDNACACLIF